MAVIIHHTECPVCANNVIEEVLLVKDYTVTKEVFPIFHCEQCGTRFTQNIPDEQSIVKYYKADTYISHTDSTKGFINKVYHFVRNITLQQKKQLILQVTELQNGVLLDVGAGTGAFVHTMQQAGWQVVGIEPDADARLLAKNKFNISLRISEEFYSIVPNSINVITMWHVLEHVHQLHAYFKQIHQILKPNGFAFIAVPNYTSKDATIYKETWAAYDVPRHLYHFAPTSIEYLAHQYNLQLIAKKPMWFDSFYVSMLSEKYKGGNLVSAFINGCLSNLAAMQNVNNCSSIIYILQKK